MTQPQITRADKQIDIAYLDDLQAAYESTEPKKYKLEIKKIQRLRQKIEFLRALADEVFEDWEEVEDNDPFPSEQSESS